VFLLNHEPPVVVPPDAPSEPEPSLNQFLPCIPTIKYEDFISLTSIFILNVPDPPDAPVAPPKVSNVPGAPLAPFIAN
jgi:hypothetical protein